MAAELSDGVMPGVVSLPHGFGHGRPGIALAVAAACPDTSANDVTDERFLGALNGKAAERRAGAGGGCRSSGGKPPMTRQSIRRARFR